MEPTTDVHRRQGWLAAATDRAILRRSIVTCMVVGTILTAINQGDRLALGEFDAVMAWQIGLTYIVPFVVATSSGAAAMRSRGLERHADHTDSAGAQGWPTGI